MTKAKIKVLSLNDAVERRAKFEENFIKKSHEPFSFFDGIYGKHLSKETLKMIYSSEKANKKIGRDLTLGEIGATYSHYLMYKEAIAEDLDYCIILEDDSNITEHFDATLHSILKIVDPNDSAVVFIQKHTINNNVILSNKKERLNDNHVLQRMLGSSQYFIGSYGYVVTRKSMRQLLNSYMPIYCVCDHWYHIKKQSLIDTFFCITPSIVDTNPENIREIDSFINEERKKILIKREMGLIAKSKIKIKKIVLRILDKDWE